MRPEEVPQPRSADWPAVAAIIGKFPEQQHEEGVAHHSVVDFLIAVRLFGLGIQFHEADSGLNVLQPEEQGECDGGHAKPDHPG
jgi:hypothetical protein